MIIYFFLSLCNSNTAISLFWGKILSQYTSNGIQQKVRTRLVDYNQLAESQSFKMIVRLIGGTQTSFQSEAEKVAYYINAYNIAAANAVIHSGLYLYPEGSTRYNAAKKVMSELSFQVYGNIYTLNSLYDYIVTYFDDPRLLFALCTTTLSSPPLLKDPYTAQALEQQLDGQVQLVLTNKVMGMHALKYSKKLFLNRLFDVYEDQFTVLGGIESFLKQNSTLSKIDQYTIFYLPINDTLNTKTPVPAVIQTIPVPTQNRIPTHDTSIKNGPPIKMTPAKRVG